MSYALSYFEGDRRIGLYVVDHTIQAIGDLDLRRIDRLIQKKAARGRELNDC